jgi:alkylation response protein AidB-like acyl-CoA dehydrogenase
VTGALDAARRMAGSLAARSAAIETAGRLPDDVVADLRDSGIPALWLPAELGGAEAAPVDVVDSIAALSAADGSTGWCAAVAVGTNALAPYLPEAGAREIFSSPSTLTAGSFNPAGRATADGDGNLRLSGRWGFGSGGSHSDWLAGACLLVDDAGEVLLDDEGRPQPRVALFPVADTTIHDTWHVSGLRATASHDYEVEALSVPAAHTLPLPFSPWPAAAMWRIPPMPLFFAPLAAVALGIARGAVDDLIDLAQTKTPYRSTRRLAERDVVQSMVARAEAATRSARAFLVEALDALLARGEEVSLPERAVARLAVVNAASAAATAVDLCFAAAGTTALFADHPLQRRHRDVHALGQHVVLAFPGFETVGRVLFGLDPDTPLV